MNIDISKMVPPKRKERKSPQYKEWDKYIELKKSKINYDDMFEEMTARDQSALYENKSKWAFIYERMKYNATFNKLKSNIEAVHVEKDQPHHQERGELLEKYFS